MKKRFLSALLAVLMLVTLIPAAAFGAEIIAGGYCGAYRDDDLEWELDSEGTLTIRATWQNVIGATPMQNCSEEGGPWCVYADSIRNVVVEDGVFDIADNAFCGCTQMQSLTMSDDVVFLGHAFAGCTGLQTVTIGRGGQVPQFRPVRELYRSSKRDHPGQRHRDLELCVPGLQQPPKRDHP